MALLVLSFPVSPSMGRKKCSKACASSQGWAKGQPCPQGTGRALPAPLRGLALKGRPSAVPGLREPSTCFCPPCQRQEAPRAQRPPVWGSAELVPGLEGRAEHSAAQGGNAASARSPRTRLSRAGPPRDVQLGKRRVIRILSGRASTKAESRDSARSCASPFTAASCTAAQLGSDSHVRQGKNVAHTSRGLVPGLEKEGILARATLKTLCYVKRASHKRPDIA